MPKRARTHTPVQAVGCKHEACRHRQADRERGTAAQRGYDRRWRRLREAKLRADPLCEHCLSQGRTAPAQDVDHIQPISERPDLRLDWANLQSLCRRCHNRKTAGTRAPVGIDGWPLA